MYLYTRLGLYPYLSLYKYISINISLSRCRLFVSPRLFTRPVRREAAGYRPSPRLKQQRKSMCVYIEAGKPGLGRPPARLLPPAHPPSLQRAPGKRGGWLVGGLVGGRRAEPSRADAALERASPGPPPAARSRRAPRLHPPPPPLPPLPSVPSACGERSAAQHRGGGRPSPNPPRNYSHSPSPSPPQYLTLNDDLLAMIPHTPPSFSALTHTPS